MPVQEHKLYDLKFIGTGSIGYLLKFIDTEAVKGVYLPRIAAEKFFLFAVFVMLECG